jgi:amidase
LSSAGTPTLNDTSELTFYLTNCLSEILFKSAERRAEQLDEDFTRRGRTSGPLHGLPVSLKDRFRLDGVETACGYVSWLGKNEDAASESLLVKKLKHLGAIFFVKTNVPMSLLVSSYFSI